MAESKIQNAFSRTALWTVGKLLLFVAGGFTVGLVLGIFSEEPGLLVGHLRGNTETIELDATLAAQVEADAASARAREEAEREKAERAREDAAAQAARATAEPGEDVSADALIATGAAEPSAADALPDVSAPPPEQGAGESTGSSPRIALIPAGGATSPWAIQVGAFGDEPSAEELANRLEAKGYPIEILPATATSNRWRVRVQPLDGEATARATAVRLEREERLPTWVLRLEGEPRG